MTDTANAKTIRVRGQVQGVGFRPFVWQLASRFGISGEVRNDAQGVLIQAQGERMTQFVTAISEQPPPLARIDSIEVSDTEIAFPNSGFEITSTSDGLSRTRVTPDAKICIECAAEILDPAERRFGYPFANCTHCGPRFSIIEKIPYDRASTTMRVFQMCDDCDAEYRNPGNRRFHAQPIACPACGPQVWIETRDGDAIETADPIAEAVKLLRKGEILGVKGLGGFHLVCDALSDGAVRRLRDRKRRPTKPLALMARDVEAIRRFAEVSESERHLLESAAGPIVLLKSLEDTALSKAIAPDQWASGWMLPTTPFHLLLMDQMGSPLVMTSGNLSGEPQVIGNEEARQKLNPFVDGFVFHNRDISRRLDDSVARMAGGKVRMQRRARGYAPESFALPDAFKDAPAVTAYGAFLKSSLCLLRDGQATLSHHLGDLGDALTAEEFEKADRDYAELLDHQPSVIACDAHPDYPSTAHAETVAGKGEIFLTRVQHHHAHIAAVMAENKWAPSDGKVLGVAMDGLGWGEDATVWGGEWLLVDYASFERVGHLRPVPLPGGGAAQAQPWRNLFAQLVAAGLDQVADKMLSDHPLATLRVAVERGINTPLTSSAGRLFDAVAAALGVAPVQQSFEGEAAMTLETLARRGKQGDGYPFDLSDRQVDPGPMWHALLKDIREGRSVEDMAARFHIGFADAICVHSVTLSERFGASAIALSGGCFQNTTLLELCLSRLEGHSVLSHSLTPPNDGCISLGQAVIAAWKAMHPDPESMESN